ncbi:MAG TPA: hypothetical protein VEF89_23700 [Solirubrobacteraceae bacterium]|nr:hypothetical protein [Solirubrobacteraceae bacterium]
MTDEFSQYVTLLDEIEQIPVIARESPNYSAEERGATVARVVAFVRDRVLPQSDRDCAGREALFDYGGGAAVADVALRSTSHDAILARLESLARVNPTDAPRVQAVLYRLHAAIAAHFSEAELMLASMIEEGLPTRPGPRIRAREMVAVERTHPSAWFG